MCVEIALTLGNTKLWKNFSGQKFSESLHLLLCLLILCSFPTMCLWSAAAHGTSIVSWERKERDGAQTSWITKEKGKGTKKKMRDHLFIKAASFLIRLDSAGRWSKYLSRWHFSLLFFFPPLLSHETPRTLKYLLGISVKNGCWVVTVRSSSGATTTSPRSHVTVMWSSLNNSCLWFQGKLGARFPLRWQWLTTPVI